MKKKTISLECLIRSPDVVDLLEDYDNDYFYYLNGHKLDLAKSLKVRNHSPSGFRHGYAGSGPAQLALSICLELYSLPVAKAVYQYFKQEYIASLPLNEEFKEALVVPLDPITYWKIPQEAIHWEEPQELEVISEEERAEEEVLKREKQDWQERLDCAYEEVLHLRGDQEFRFSTRPGGAEDSFCYIRLFDPTEKDKKVTVVATDPGDEVDSGMSITNAAEMVAQQVCETFSIPIEKLRWIERYVDKPSVRAYKDGRDSIKERWDEVNFGIRDGVGGTRLFNPDWHPLKAATIKELKRRSEIQK